MIKVCIADSLPVVSYGLQSYFKGNSKIEIVAVARNLESLLQELNSKKVAILLLDVELVGLSSIREIKSLLKDYPETKIVLYRRIKQNRWLE